MGRARVERAHREAQEAEVTTAELIAALQQHSDDAEVLLSDEFALEPPVRVDWALPCAEFPTGAVIILTRGGAEQADLDLEDTAEGWEDDE